MSHRPSSPTRVAAGLRPRALWALLLSLGCVLPAAARQDRILLIVADDLGTDHLSFYGAAPELAASTPNLQRLVDEGVLFENVWSNPICSPTRATLQTGRYSYRTGVGAGVWYDDSGLQSAEWTVAEMLSAAGYQTALFGKWHLNGEFADGHSPEDPMLGGPAQAGYQTFVGTPRNLEVYNGDYFGYWKISDGDLVRSRRYATEDTARDALGWIREHNDEPWFVTVTFHAPHAPLHAPPAQFLPSGDLPPEDCSDARACYRGMIEALDTMVGRLIRHTRELGHDPLILFVGDNGGFEEVLQAPYPAGHGKGSLYEGGIRVPLLAWGPGVAAGEVSDALVNATDLLATIAEHAEIDLGQAVPPGTELDSCSLAPVMADPAAASQRTWVYSDLWYDGWDRAAVRDDCYKLISDRLTGAEALYDLCRDGRSELTDRLFDPSPEDLEARDRLAAILAQLDDRSLSGACF